MITETVMRLILRCNRCNAPFRDPEEDHVVHWVDRAAIGKAFPSGMENDAGGWRRIDDRILCDDCWTTPPDECDWYIEREPLPPIDAAVINRAQALHLAGMLAVIWPGDLRVWLEEQPDTPLRRAVQAAIEAAFEGRVEDWGPAVGSKAEGIYERAHAVYYAIEDVLRPSIATSVMAAAVPGEVSG